MDKEQLWNLINEKRPDLLEGKDLASITDEEITSLARMAMEPKPVTDPPENDPAKTGTPDKGDGETPLTKEDLDLFRCEQSLDRTLGASELPDSAKTRIRQAFKDRVFEQADLDTAIGEEKDYIAQMARPAGDGDPEPVQMRIIVGIDTIQRAQMAVDRAFGITKDDMVAFARMECLDHQPFFGDTRSVQDYDGFDDVPAFRGIREMYEFYTGDPQVTGIFNKRNLPPALRASADVTSSTFTYVLGNTMGRRLVREYRDLDYMENLIVSIKKPGKDFRTQEAVLVGGFPDIATVDPESGDYQEITGVTDEEATYTILQKGNLLTITRKTIINDDISIIQRLLRGVGRAIRRTHGKYVWAFIIDNGTCTDGTAIFTSGHGNLGATALSHAQALVAYKAIGSFTEKDSGEPLGLLADRNVKPNLIGPIDIMETMDKIENEDFYYSSNDLTTKIPNPLRGKVVHHVHPLFTDANDWAMMLPPNVVDIIEMSYLNGREEPELFVADTPQSEQVFVADKIRHKFRHEYAGTPVDYRGGYKAEVA